jgi:chromate transporter
MSTLTLYLLLLKATLASFSGFGSLPQLRDDLVIQRQVLTDDALNRAVLVARTTPGPMGVFVVSVGYEVAGPGGAAAGWLAMATPALLIIPLYGASAMAMHHPRVRNAIGALVLASAALIIMTSGPLLREIIDRWAIALGW